MNDPGQDGAALPAQYTNFFRIGYNQLEFLIDFGQVYSEDKSPELHTRIVTGPAYAKALAKLLRRSVEKYEELYGLVEPDTDD